MGTLRINVNVYIYVVEEIPPDVYYLQYWNLKPYSADLWCSEWDKLASNIKYRIICV
jgi:hypothetical protein